MKLRWVVVIALCSLALGSVGASWYWNDFYAAFNNQGFLLRTQADLITRVNVLEQIRAGKVAEATRFLEEQLDGDLIGAAALARDGKKFNGNAVRAVALEAKARASSGYMPADEGVQNAIRDAFRLIPASALSNDAQQFNPGDRQQAGVP